MAKPEFPETTVLIDCPIEGCEGQISVGLQVRLAGKSGNVKIKTGDFTLQGAHNHQEPPKEPEPPAETP